MRRCSLVAKLEAAGRVGRGLPSVSVWAALSLETWCPQCRPSITTITAIITVILVIFSENTRIYTKNRLQIH